MASLVDLLPAPGSDPVAVLDAFGVWAAEGGRSLYPHQEEAALALAAGDHVVLATPTGSGKSLVAVAGILLARNEGRRAVWTAPIKALVAEKFFDLVDLLGAGQVGLATGDAAINAGAPVLVCTAEVLANQALMTGPSSDVGFACLDEFHFYGDTDRGWAWQVPLLELTRCQFLLASATLGDMTAIRADLEERSGRSGDVGDVGAPPDPAVPPVAHDDRRRQRERSGRRRALPRLRRPRQPGCGDRAGSGPRQPQRHQPHPTRGDRRGAAGRADGTRLRGHPRSSPAQRCRRPPRRDAPSLPPPGRASGRPGLAAGHLRHGHARGRRQHPDPHGADDGAHQVRRQPRPALHGARVPPARRARRTARVRPRRARVGAGARARHRERQGPVACRRRPQGTPQGDQSKGP